MKAKKSILIIFFSTALLFIFLGWSAVSAYSIDPQTPGTILYVKPGEDGTCTSWANACELQTALSNAVAGDQIWVAVGTYKPTADLDRTATFQLVSGVAIYGGFPVEGGDWETRDWETNFTILSGDIGGVGYGGDDSYHVVTGSGVDATAVLDGFTITDGNANGSNEETNDRGGGMYNDQGSPSLSNVTFSGNSADYGGGMYDYNNSSPSLSNVTFSSNLATYVGGGMYNMSSNPSLSNVTFSDNTTTGDYSGGGGMYNAISSPSLSNVTFSSNSADSGGGMYNINNSSPSLSNVTFSSNSAYYYGGGMYNYESSPSLSNVTFSSNSTYYSGGGMYNLSNSPTVTNSIFWGNIPEQIYTDNPASVTVTYSDIQGGYTGNGNINEDPLLGPLADNGGFTQTHALGLGSPAIDAGNPSNCPATDQRGAPRPFDGDGVGTAICDMGAYEYATFSLTLDIAGSGSIAKDPDKLEYLWGEEVTLTATADPNWIFLGWSGDASGTDNPLSITIEGNTSITAKFINTIYLPLILR